MSPEPEEAGKATAVIGSLKALTLGEDVMPLCGGTLTVQGSPSHV